MDAMPMLTPRADKRARTRRLRSPMLPTRSRSRHANFEETRSPRPRRITAVTASPPFGGPASGYR